MERKTQQIRLFITLSSKTKRHSSLPYRLPTRKNCAIALLSNTELQSILAYLPLSDLSRLHEALRSSPRTNQAAKTLINYIAHSDRIISQVQLKQFLQYYILRKRKLNKWWPSEKSCDRNDWQRISWDVERTSVWFCRSAQQIQNMRGFISRVLNRLCGITSRYDYVQGFHCVIKAMFESGLSQNQSWMLGSYFLKEMRLGKYYQNKQEKMRELCYVLDVYVFNNLPQLHMHLKKYDLNAQCYAISWFLTLFSQGLPLSVLNRLWILFIVKGWKVMIKFAVALLCLFQSQILAKQQGQLPQFLCGLQQQLSYNKQRVLWQMYSSIKVTNQMIVYLSKSMNTLEFDRQISILQLKEMRDMNPNSSRMQIFEQKIFPSYFSTGLCCQKVEPSPPSFLFCSD